MAKEKEVQVVKVINFVVQSLCSPVLYLPSMNFQIYKSKLIEQQTLSDRNWKTPSTGVFGMLLASCMLKTTSASI